MARHVKSIVAQVSLRGMESTSRISATEPCVASAPPRSPTKVDEDFDVISGIGVE